MRIYAILVLICLAFQLNDVHAKNFYRYKDSNGKVVVRDYLPTEAVNTGYEVISESGRVLEVVQAALTREERIAENLRQEQLKAQADTRRKERQKDTLLMRQYQTVEDIERSKSTQTATLRINLRIVDNHTKSLNRKLQEQETRAAGYERQGKIIPEMVLNEIAAIKNQIQLNEDSVERYGQQIEDIDKQFKLDRIRFQELKAEQYISDSLKDPNAESLDNMFNCTTEEACTNAWRYAQIFAHENASRPLSIITDTLIVSHKPQFEKEFSLSITKVPVRNEEGAMNILLNVTCLKSDEGKKFCAGEQIKSIKKQFINYLFNNS